MSSSNIFLSWYKSWFYKYSKKDNIPLLSDTVEEIKENN
jgi:hypothetical protein